MGQRMNNVVFVNHSVKGTPALRSSTKARDLIILQWEFVVVSDFLVNSYRLFAVDYNLLLAFNRDYFCVTIWLKEKNVSCNYSRLFFQKFQLWYKWFLFIKNVSIKLFTSSLWNYVYVNIDNWMNNCQVTYIATMINKPRQIATFGRIDNRIQIDTE